MLATPHSSPEDAAGDFPRIKPEFAVYTHYTPPGTTSPKSHRGNLSRTPAVYSGPLEAGADLMSISIGDSVTIKRFGE